MKIPAFLSSDMPGLGWFSIFRIGIVQATIGALVMLATTVLNRLMVVELSLAAALPAGLVAWHYGVQLARPLFGHGSDQGRRRTPWILGGMAVLALGALLATHATMQMHDAPIAGLVLAVLAYTLIGLGVGACGTSALALLASGVAPPRRAAAAALTWIMMVAGIVISAISVGTLLSPFSPEQLIKVATGLAIICTVLCALAVFRLERKIEPNAFAETAKAHEAPGFGEALHEIWQERAARRFTVYIFVSMIAFSMQDLILEPFAGLVFNMDPGASTKLGGQHQGGILAGMILAGIGGSAFSARAGIDLRKWMVAGCLGSAAALGALAVGAIYGPGWPLGINVAVLGLMNGIFAVSSIGSMMQLAGAGAKTREGVRMGVWGASQAIAFGLGGLIGAVGVDVARAIAAHDGSAFQLIFAIEAGLFVAAAALAYRSARTAPSSEALTKVSPAQIHREKEVLV